jgi:hypothetical protein
LLPGQREGREYEENVRKVFNYTQIGTYNYRRDREVTVEYFGGKTKDPFEREYNYNMLPRKQNEPSKNKNGFFEIDIDLSNAKLSGAEDSADTSKYTGTGFFIEMNAQKVVEDILWRCSAAPECDALIPNDDAVTNEWYFWIGKDNTTTPSQKEKQYRAIDEGMQDPSRRAELYYGFFVN